MTVSAIPEGYTSVTPYLIIRDCTQAISFYENALGAELRLSMPTPDGKIAHAEMQIGNAVIMMADEYPEMDVYSPLSIGGSAVSLMVYCEDVDATFEKAIACGADMVRPVEDQFYGDRSGTLKDPYGHVWTISTHKEDLSEEELAERAKEMFSEG